MTRVLVFDSGVGGLSVFDAIAAQGLSVRLDYAADTAWLPYGEKPDAALIARAPALLAAAVAQLECDAVVVACNTLSTIALDAIRAALPIPVVGVVPPIKPAAAMTRSGVIGLLATPATVRRAYTDRLIAEHAPDKIVIRYGSSALVQFAEAVVRGDPGAPDAIADAIAGLFGAPRGEEIDVVALACTHFPFLTPTLAAASPRAVAWLDSGAAVARRLATVCALSPGATALGVAAVTDAGAGASLAAAFKRRGFSDLRAFDDRFILRSGWSDLMGVTHS
ncbi:MAG: glutamate racemase [Alphaproteobacteria bacterium]|nr:glutamate racemase [Alphaproteobacteria bacterium]